MDEALELDDYLPVSFKAPNEQDYIAFLWETFQENYATAKYQFAFLAYHMLMMSFVYFNIWQIKQTRPNDFKKGLIGFAKEEASLRSANSPFSFSIVNERAVFRFLKLIACDNSKIGTYGKLVDDRNSTAHSNGNIFFRAQGELDAKIREVLRAVSEIQTYSQPIIVHCYEKFLLESHDPDKREYPIVGDQIQEVLIRDNYMSRKDIELCTNFDISTLPHGKKQATEELHSVLRVIYGTIPSPNQPPAGLLHSKWNVNPGSESRGV